MFTHVIFDLDGTLLDTLEDLKDSVNHVLRAHGYCERTLEEVRAFLGNGAAMLLRRALPDTVGEEEFSALLTEYKAWYQAHNCIKTRPYPGIPELLRDLKASGVRLAVATGKPTVFSEQILEHFELRQYFDIVSGIPLNREPPDKCEVILHALYEMGISDRSGCVMVGDRSHDAIGAKMAQIDFIGVLYGYGSREELEAEGTDAIADSVVALRTLLLS